MTVQPANTTSLASQTMKDNSMQNLKEKEKRPQTAEMQATEDQFHIMADAPSNASAIPASEGKATSSALVEKYEIGSGKNKINVWIFKEPAAEPFVQESQEDMQTKQVETNTGVKIEKGL